MSSLASANTVKRVDPMGTLKYHHEELGKLKNKVETLPNYADQSSELKQTLISLQVTSLDTSTHNKQTLTDLVSELETLKTQLNELKGAFDSTSNTVITLSQDVNDLKADVPVNEGDASLEKTD